MTALLANPLVQSALLPFMLTLVLAFALRSLVPRWWGLALPMSFYPAALLIAGVDLWPLTSTRKILVLGVVAVIVALILSWRPIEGRPRIVLLAVVISSATCWVLWPLLMRTEGMVLFSLVGASLVFMLYSVLLSDLQRADVPVQLLSASLYSVGIAVAAMTGGSALLGQLAGALAAVTGGLLVVVLLANKVTIRDILLLPASLMAGLLGLTAVVYASLAWQGLLCLMLLPLLSFIPLKLNNVWIKLLVLLLLMLVIISGAVYISWSLASGDSGNGYY